MLYKSTHYANINLDKTKEENDTMKKTVSIIIMVMMVVALITTTTYAATPVYAIELKADKTEVYQGEEVTVTLRVKDFQDITNGLMGFVAQLEYDTGFFETLTQENIKGKGTWSSAPTFNPATNLLTADSGTGVKTEGDVFTVTLKVKANALVGTSTTVKVKNFEAAEGETELKAKEDATIAIMIKQKEEPNKPSVPDTNTITNDVNNALNITDTNTTTNNIGNLIVGNTTNTAKNMTNTNTQTGNKIPQTGDQDWIFITLIATVVIGMFSYVKYRSMK